jgi:hypothetical protein
VAEPSDVRAVFFFHEQKVAVVSFGIAQASFLERMRAGEAIPLRTLGIRATHVRIESGAETLYVMTVDDLMEAEDGGKLYDLRFKPFRP